MSKYTFTRISKASTNFSVFQSPAINDAGTVAFEGFIDGVSPPSGILKGSGAENTTIVTAAPFTNIFYSPTINNNGTTTFVGTFYSADFTQAYMGIFRKTGEQYRTITDSTGRFNYFSVAATNNTGAVAFNTILDNGNTGIYLSKGGQITTIASSRGRFSDFYVGFDTVGGDGPPSAYSIPSINDRGVVAFHAKLDTGATGIFAGSGKGTRTIADSTGMFNSFSSPSINNSGTVAFMAQKDNGQHGIYKVNRQGELRTVVDENGPFSFFNSDPALNDQGDVAFLAYLDAGGSGIYTGRNPATSKVIVVGDSLGGSRVAQLVIAEHSLNNNGQIAFGAILENGTQAIFRADPVVTNHDAVSMTIGVFAIAGLCWFRRSK